MMRHEYVVWTICLAISWGQFAISVIKERLRARKRRQWNARCWVLEHHAKRVREQYSSPYR